METRMMKALGSVQEVPGPGEVLRLGPTGSFVWHPEYDSLFIRGCYPRLVDVLTRQPGSRRYIGRWRVLALAYAGAQSLV